MIEDQGLKVRNPDLTFATFDHVISTEPGRTHDTLKPHAQRLYHMRDKAKKWGIKLFDLGQPGQGRAIYLSAHARRGMFGPIYDRVIARRDPDSLLGMHVFVWASDGLRFEYVIDEVRTKQTSVYEALVAKDEQLWLQTSEGPRGTVGVTQVIALPVGTGPVPDAADASPSPRPRACR